MKKTCLYSFVFLLTFCFVAPKVNAATTPVTSVSQTESERQVREFFKDTPVMIEIARCESNFRQFTDSGSVLRGGLGGGMIGVFQFFESIHTTPAKAVGFDISTLEGNLGYAQHLYKMQGTTPWNSARHCWDIESTTIKVPATRAELEVRINQLTQIIKLLKQLLELKSR